MVARGAISDPTCEGTLEIDGVLLNTVAYSVSGLYNLWGTRVDVRGTDRTIPYAQGQIQYPRWLNALRVSLPMLITGHVTSAGVAAADPMAQLAEHLTWLTAVVTPPDPTGGVPTLPAVLTLPNGPVLTADVIPLGLTPGDVTMSIMRATLELSVPAGRFT